MFVRVRLVDQEAGRNLQPPSWDRPCPRAGLGLHRDHFGLIAAGRTAEHVDCGRLRRLRPSIILALMHFEL
jgi:hypothetical protein